ncbi:unknown [Clostridium sp. CAG:710]|nr:unknown [Clostridium sp. CAG:710]
MEEKNKSVKNVKVNPEIVKKNFQYKLKRAVAIVGTVIVIGSGMGIHFSREKDKENVNSYLSGISVSESISEYEQLKQIKIEDIKDWLEISEDSIKYEDKVVKVIKDNTDYELDELPTGSLEEYKKAVKEFNDMKDPSTVKEKEKKLKAAITIAKCAQDANEKLRKYGYDLGEETLRLLKEDFRKHSNIEGLKLSEIKVKVPSDSLKEAYISMEERNLYYEFNGGYVLQVASSIGAVQSARRGESKESDVFGYNKDRTEVIKNTYEAYMFLAAGYTTEEQWNITDPKSYAVTDKHYKCKTRDLNEIIKSSKEANLTEGRSR